VLLSFTSEFFGRNTSETRLEYLTGRTIRPNKRSGFYILRVTPLLSVHSFKVFRVHRERDTKCPQQRIFTGTFTLCLSLDFSDNSPRKTQNKSTYKCGFVRFTWIFATDLQHAAVFRVGAVSATS